jgi:importin subunit beta-1
MTLLLENLSNPALHRSVKPQILSVFGDMALSIGPDFKKYLNIVLQMLVHATQVQFDPNDYDMIDYMNDLRESVLESFTGIIQGLKGMNADPHPDVALMQPHVPFIIKFIMTIALESGLSDNNIAISAGLIGDLCSAFGPPLIQLLDNDTITNLLQEGKKSGTNRTKTLSNWALKEIRKLKQSQQPVMPANVVSW